jgi:hypothetical protein
MPSAAFPIVFSLDREQSPKPPSDSPLPNLAIIPTLIENGLRIRAESQLDDNCPLLSNKLVFTLAFSSDAPNLGNSPRRSETLVISLIQPNSQDRVQYALGASLEKDEEVETIPHIQQVERLWVLREPFSNASSPIPMTTSIRPPSKFCANPEANNRFAELLEPN